jgi:hypothetical protein
VILSFTSIDPHPAKCTKPLSSIDRSLSRAPSFSARGAAPAPKRAFAARLRARARSDTLLSVPVARPLSQLIALSLAACGAEGGTLLSAGAGSSSSAATAATSTDAHTTDTTDAGAQTSATSATDLTTEAPPRWDLAEGPEPAPVGPAWCTAKKVDFVFILGRGEYMAKYQAALLKSLPGFIDAITTVFEGFDYHIIVVPNDGGYWGASKCITKAACPNDFGCIPTEDPLYPCWANGSSLVTACDGTLGAGVVFPAGKGASNRPCPMPAGRRYLKAGDPDLKEVFQCIAQVGAYNQLPHVPAMTMIDMLDPSITELNGAGGCNEGFIRQDALLFFAQISTGGDVSPYNPYFWYQKVMFAKDWDPKAVFALGINYGHPDDNSSYCPTAWLLPVQEFIDYFPHSLVIPLCQADYTAGFWQAAEAALALCEPDPPE